MTQFTAEIKKLVKEYNEKNPDKRETSMTSIAKKIGVQKQYLSQINTNFKDQLNAHFNVVFMSDDKEQIQKTWEQYLKLKSDKLIQRLELIRIELGVEIWELIEKTDE